MSLPKYGKKDEERLTAEMGGHTTDLRELLAAVRNLLMALKDVPYLPPPVWAALDDVRLAVAPDIGPPPDNGPIGRRNHHMTRLEKILRHEILITFGIGEILVIVVLVVTINAIWPEAPFWAFIAAGGTIGAVKPIIGRWMRRSPSPKPPQSSSPP